MKRCLSDNSEPNEKENEPSDDESDEDEEEEVDRKCIFQHLPFGLMDSDHMLLQVDLTPKLNLNLMISSKGILSYIFNII